MITNRAGGTNGKKLIKLLMLFCLLLTLGSCCTILTLRDVNPTSTSKYEQCRGTYISSIVYSGTYLNASKVILFPFNCGEECMYIVFYPAILVMGLVDLPLDIAADTLILPYTIPLYQSCTKEKKVETPLPPQK